MTEKTTFYRNSDLKVNRYFAKPSFRLQLKEASSHGKEVFYNEVRKLNNCYYARKLEGDVSIKDIFTVFWKEFKEKYSKRLTRPHLIESIETMIGCHNFDNGYLFYECPHCNDFYMIGFSCHSRFCPSCGQKYKKARTEKVSEKCLSIPHRQFVFTIPEQLRPYFQKYHGLLNVLFQTVKDTLNSCLERHAPIAYKKEKRRLGFISFLHTFGRDLKWHPHLHILLAERYITNTGNIKKYDYFPFDFIRITFQNKLFHNIYVYCRDVIKNKTLSQQIYKLCLELKSIYHNGYYIYGPKFSTNNTTTRDIKELTNYVARYASHPPISERRILSFDVLNKTVTWYYDPHEDDDIKDEEQKKGRQIITESVFSFMAKLIVHIPDKSFQIIRYYGFYANKYKDKITDKMLFSDAQLKKMKDNIYWVNGLISSFGYNPILCKCGSIMKVNFSLSYFP